MYICLVLYLNAYNEKIIQKTKNNILENFEKSKILRFLYTSKFDYEETLKSISHYIEWKTKFFPINLTDNLIEILGFS